MPYFYPPRSLGLLSIQVYPQSENQACASLGSWGPLSFSRASVGRALNLSHHWEEAGAGAGEGNLVGGPVICPVLYQLLDNVLFV